MNDSKPIYVLDSFALLAFLEGEAGVEVVQGILKDASSEKSHAFLSLINLGEVVYITERERGLAKAQEVLVIIEQLPIEILPVDRKAVLEAAHIKAHFPVAYAGAFAIAAAQGRRASILTGDPEFEVVSNVVRIKWLEERSGSNRAGH